MLLTVSGLPDRLILLERECGSQRALGRFLGVPDVTIKRWKAGVTPLATKLRGAARHSGLSEEWLFNGEGDDATELAKCRAVSVEEAQTARIAEENLPIADSVRFIMERGDPSDVQMLEEILSAAKRRIAQRTAAAPSQSKTRSLGK